MWIHLKEWAIETSTVGKFSAEEGKLSIPHVLPLVAAITGKHSAQPASPAAYFYCQGHTT